MGRKLIWIILIIELIITWPLSLIRQRPDLKLETIFYPVTEDESWNLEKSLALDTSRVKRFYYNKTTIIKSRYFKNFGAMIDLNNYFFAMHPREDIPGMDARIKYPFAAILFLIMVIKVTVEKKKYGGLWGLIFGLILLLAFLRQVDGWDFILFFPLTYLLIIGSKEFNKWKWSWLINLVLIAGMAIEIGRIFL